MRVRPSLRERTVVVEEVLYTVRFVVLVRGAYGERVPRRFFNQLKPPKLQFAYFLLNDNFFCCCLLLLLLLFSIIRSLLMMLIRSRTHSSNSSLFVRATLLQKEDLSSHKSPDHNDLCSHATSKVDIDDISLTLNPFFKSLARDDLFTNFLVSLFTPYKNLRSVPLSLHITCFSTISRHAPPFSDASLNKRHNGKGGVFSSAATRSLSRSSFVEDISFTLSFFFKSPFRLFFLIGNFCRFSLLRKRDKIQNKFTKAMMMSEGEKVTPVVTSRARKRKVGERDSLWDLVVNNDDISLTHIVPRLNQTDVKFLYGVNSETRKLIKRSFGVDNFKWKFEVKEMSSISTLEFAWEHKSLWSGRLKDETDFCEKVAETNKLELLKWIREEKKCEWDEDTIEAAACKGNLEMVKYCVANECPIRTKACAWAARCGHLEVLKYLHEEAKVPWDPATDAWAAGGGHLHILEYLVERKYDQYDNYACFLAAEFGHLDCLKYLHETAKAPWDGYAFQGARKNKHPECVQYLLDNDCPLLPDGWRYVNGELHIPESDSESESE